MTRAISGRPARCLKNKFTTIGEQVNAELIPDYPIAYDAGKALDAVARAKGEEGYTARWAGAGVGACRQLSASKLVAELAAEFADIYSECYYHSPKARP